MENHTWKQREYIDDAVTGIHDSIVELTKQPLNAKLLETIVTDLFRLSNDSYHLGQVAYEVENYKSIQREGALNVVKDMLLVIENEKTIENVHADLIKKKNILEPEWKYK